MKLIKQKQPFFRALIHQRGFDPVEVMKTAMKIADSRFDVPTVLPSYNWRVNFTSSFEYGKMCRELFDDPNVGENIDELVNRVIDAVIKRTKARTNVDRMANRIANRKLDYPKELSLYEISIIARTIGMSPSVLIDSISDGYDPSSLSVMRPDEYTTKLKSLSIKNTNLRKENKELREQLKKWQEEGANE